MDFRTIPIADIELVKLKYSSPGKDFFEARLGDTPVKIQMPRSKAVWGVSKFDAFSVDVTNTQFLDFLTELDEAMYKKMKEALPGKSISFRPCVKEDGPKPRFTFKVKRETAIFHKDGGKVKKEDVPAGSNLHAAVRVAPYVCDDSGGVSFPAAEILMEPPSDEEDSALEEGERKVEDESENRKRPFSMLD
jgi:hypothetical protein